MTISLQIVQLMQRTSVWLQQMCRSTQMLRLRITIILFFLSFGKMRNNKNEFNLWGDWNVCTFELLWLFFGKEVVFSKITPSLFTLKEGSTSHPDPLSSGAREKTALLGARNRYAIRLADHQRSSPCCAGWDRLGIAVYSLQLISWLSKQIFLENSASIAAFHYIFFSS